MISRDNFSEQSVLTFLQLMKTLSLTIAVKRQAVTVEIRILLESSGLGPLLYLQYFHILPAHISS